MRKFAASLLIILVLCSLCCFPANAAVTLDVSVSAEAAYCINLDTGTVVYEKNADEQLSVASTIKLLTALTALKLCADPDNTEVTVPENMWSYFTISDISVSGIQPGEKLSMTDLLYCLILPSGCDAAVAIACYFGYDEFISQMNALASELGCTGTVVKNPHGLYQEGHVSTAHDLALIAKAAFENDLIYTISSKSRYTLQATNLNGERTISATNFMLDSQTKYYTDFVKAGKTGKTDEGGRAIAAIGEKGGVRYLVTLVGCPIKTDGKWPEGYGNFNDCYALLSACFNQLTLTTAVSTDTPISQINVSHSARKDALVLYPQSDVTLLVRKDGEGCEITWQAQQPDSAEAPIASGDVLGSADILLGGEKAAEVPLISREDIELSYFVVAMDAVTTVLKSTPVKIIGGLLLLALVAYLYYIFIVVPRARRSKKRRRK